MSHASSDREARAERGEEEGGARVATLLSPASARQHPYNPRACSGRWVSPMGWSTSEHAQVKTAAGLQTTRRSAGVSRPPLRDEGGATPAAFCFRAEDRKTQQAALADQRAGGSSSDREARALHEPRP